LRKVLGPLVSALVLAGVLAFALAPVGRAGAAPEADGGTEAAFVSAVNSIRVSKGLEPLKVYGELVSVARNWTDQMIAAGDIAHNRGLAGSVGAPWVKLGENVGIGYSVEGLINAFVASPTHYKNIVQPEFRWIGVGVSWNGDGRMMTTHLFMAMAGDDAQPAPEPEPAPPPVAAIASGAQAPASPASPLEPAPVPPPPADPVRVQAVLADLRLVTA